MIMYSKPIRHGDVDLIPTSIPQGAKPIKNDIVMHGENGHEHKLINGQILVIDDRKFVKSNQQTFLIHEEHGKKPIPYGEFEIKQEQEFDPFERVLRRVRD